MRLSFQVKGEGTNCQKKPDQINKDSTIHSFLLQKEYVYYYYTDVTKHRFVFNAEIKQVFRDIGYHQMNSWIYNYR